MGSQGNLNDYIVDYSGVYKKTSREKHAITNFLCEIPYIISASNDYSSLQVIVLRCIYLDQSNIEYHEIELTYDELIEFDPSQYDIRMQIMPGKTNHQEFVRYVQLLAAAAENKSMLLADKLGGLSFKGKHGYCIGDAVIGCDFDNVDVYFLKKLRKYHVSYDRAISPKQALMAFLHYLDIEPGITEIVGLHAITGFLGELYDLGCIPDAGVLYIVGATQSRKTSMLALGTNLYATADNPRSNIIRTDSSLSVIQDFLAGFSCGIAVLDDIYRDPVNHREIRQKTQSILRQKADRTVRKNTRSQADITHTGICMTAEILPDSISDLGRTQLVMLSKAIDSVKLTKCQQNQNKLIAFYIHLITWAYDNFDRIIGVIKRSVAAFLYGRTQTPTRFERLLEHSFVSELSLKLVLLYTKERNLLDDEEIAVVEESVSHSIELCTALQEKAMEEVAKNSGEKKFDPSKALCIALDSGAIQPGFEGDDCFYRQKDGVTFLFIRKEKIVYELNHMFKFHCGQKEIIDYFDERGILVKEAKGKARTKRTEGKRYLVLRMDILINDVDSFESFISQFM